MKKLLYVLIILGFCELAQAEMQATWEYPDTPPDIVGFKIYMDGTSVWEGNDPLQRACQFECSLTGKPISFTITARDALNESVPSEAFPLDPIPPVPTSLIVSE